MIVLNYKKYYRNIFFLVLSFASVCAFGQKYQTEEIKITYSNGINIFDVCVTNPSFDFDEEKKYSWYSKNSGSSEIKETQGGCGGNLLHGKDRFFDADGNLLYERNFNLGLLEGEQKFWASTGTLDIIIKYVNGVDTYTKRKVEDGWLEEFGKFLSDGYIRRNYDGMNNLIKESIQKKDFTYDTKEYYKYSKQIEYQYSTRVFCDTCLVGKFVSFYENGNKMVEGQYSDSLDNVKIGVWKWYKETGATDGQERYKEEVQRWPNGEKKAIGSYCYSEYQKKWFKFGVWNYYDETGRFLYRKKFNSDSEVEE